MNLKLSSEYVGRIIYADREFTIRVNPTATDKKIRSVIIGFLTEISDFRQEVLGESSSFKLEIEFQIYVGGEYWKTV